MLDSFRELWVSNRQEHAGWSQPTTYHVETQKIKQATLLFNKDHTLSDFVDIKLLGFVIIPGKLVTGVCFP